MEPVTNKSELSAKPTEYLPPYPTRTLPSKKENVYLARCSYDAKTCEYLNLKKGEKLLIIGSTEGDQWMGKSLIDGKEGYINRNYLVPVTSYEAEE